MRFLPALATALLPDPFYQALTVDSPDPGHQGKVLESYFAYSFEEGCRTGKVVVAPSEADGAAIWLLPRTDRVQSQESRQKASFLTQLLGERGSLNYHSIVDFMSPLAEKHVPANAWYLSIIGVSPSSQGQGLGVKLLLPTLAEADVANVPTYLETFSPRNIPFYARLGYEVVAEYLEPVTRSTYSIMCREASTPRLDSPSGARN